MRPYQYIRNNQRKIPPIPNFSFPHAYYPPLYSYYPYYVPYRSYPQVDTKLFIKSAKCIQNLMTSANIVVDKFTSSHQFSVDIMTAAQFSNMKAVEKLINSLGLKDKPLISYNPDGITIQFDTHENNYDMCQLSLKIRWG